MKNLSVLVGLIILLGAGCSMKPQTPITQKPPEEPSVAASTTAPVPSEPAKPPVAAIGDLKEAPPVVPTNQPLEDDSKWATLIRYGITATYPNTGPNAMKLTISLLPENDSHLHGGCYITKATVSMRRNFPNYDAEACQTITALGTGTRIDYFVLGRHLITMTKTYSASFDMDGYDRIVEKIINILD